MERVPNGITEHHTGNSVKTLNFYWDFGAVPKGSLTKANSMIQLELVISQTREVLVKDGAALHFYAACFKELEIHRVVRQDVETTFSIITWTTEEEVVKAFFRIKRQAESMARSKKISLIEWTDNDDVWEIPL